MPAEPSEPSARAITLAEADALFQPFATLYPASWVLAVSGGIDSMALLHLAGGWLKRHASHINLTIATVDHGLRRGSAGDAHMVGAVAAALGLPHTILAWVGPKPQTGIQAAARQARYELLGAFAGALPVQPAAVLTAHTADDQAETLIMRLARGSGVNGLGAMRPLRLLPGSGIPHMRPLLTVSKDRLRATLQACGGEWAEDPSNDNPMFERVRTRKALAGNRARDLGLDPRALSVSARRLQQAADALDHVARQLWDGCVDRHSGTHISIDRATFDASPFELQVRLIVRAARVMGGGSPPARLSEVENVVVPLAADTMPGRTLGGVVIRATPMQIAIYREPGRTGLPVLELKLSATAAAPVTVRAPTMAEWADIRSGLADRVLPTEVALTVPFGWRGLLPVAALGQEGAALRITSLSDDRPGDAPSDDLIED
jgi:tRNA(Ile)-lysidine synthase